MLKNEKIMKTAFNENRFASAGGVVVCGVSFLHAEPG